MYNYYLIINDTTGHLFNKGQTVTGTDNDNVYCGFYRGSLVNRVVRAEDLVKLPEKMEGVYTENKYLKGNSPDLPFTPYIP